jgi:hypothetical protein
MPGMSARSRAAWVVTGQPSASLKKRMPFLRHQRAIAPFCLRALMALSCAALTITGQPRGCFSWNSLAP